MILPVVSYSKSPIAIYINPHIRSFIFAVVILVGFYYGDGRHNYFRVTNSGRGAYNFGLWNPY